MSESQAHQLPRDEAYDLLRNPRRRFAISHLEKRQQPVSLSEIAKHVASWENDQPVEELDRPTGQTRLRLDSPDSHPET